MARIFKKTGWYSVSEESLWKLGKVLAVAVLLFGAWQAYREWDEYTLERRAGRSLEDARQMLAGVQGDSTAAEYSGEISEATLNLEQAETAWEQGSYRTALVKARVSRGIVIDVFDSIQNPGRRGEARFIYVEGEVDYRRGETGQFRQARPRDVLYEGDYVRSSSRGSAEILFDSDGTLFTVRPGTMLKVQRDLSLRGRGEPVRMEYGWVDLETTGRTSGIETVYAALRVESESEASAAFESTTETGRFAVGRGGAEIAAAESGETRQIGALQQVVQRRDELGDATALVGQPEVVGPPNNFDLNLDRDQEVVLSWNPVDGSRGYRLQVSRNRLFGEHVIDERRSKTSATLGVNSEGNFFWRVAAYGEDGVLGPWSTLRKFRVMSLDGISWTDTVPPEIDVSRVNVNGNIVILSGKTEPGVKLEIEGQRTPVDADGTFTMSVTPRDEGEVTLLISAVDASGNRTEVRRQVYIEPL
ncbi:MAG: hypothetical protein R3190_00785 [Thermoanaerobaculia bacterium]|nr:hypothetical protein [Thermoanaerobaculia bacterium]